MEGVMDRPVGDETSLQAEREKWYETSINKIPACFFSFGLFSFLSCSLTPIRKETLT